MECQTQPDTTEDGNTLVDPRSRNWFFTWNNYTKENVTQLLSYLKGNKYCFQEEKGEEGTPHLQGCIKFKNARTFGGLHKKFKEVHWEITKQLKQAEVYCQKEESRVGKIYRDDRPDVRIDEFYDWELEILEFLKHEPDDRKIYWYWDEVGNSGKTTFSKYLCVYYNAIYVGGKSNDIKFAMVTIQEKRIIIFDIQRTAKVSYEALEAVKNGIFFSGKYESGMVIFEIPHVIVFANYKPKFNKLSKDRWVVKEIVRPPRDPPTQGGDSSPSRPPPPEGERHAQ